MAEAGWAQLRQVVLATTDIERAGASVRATLGLGPGFADPELDEVGLADDTMPVGPDAFLELVAPVSTDHPVRGYLDRIGGAGGFCLSVQHPDPRAAASRAADLGIRITTTVEEFMGAHIIQLHPADCGVLLELDGIADPARWFWDDRDDVVPTPESALVEDVVAVDVAVDDPTAMAERWRALMGLPDGTPDQVDLSGRVVRFVHPEGGRRGLVAVDLAARDGVSAATHDLVGTRVRLV